MTVIELRSVVKFYHDTIALNSCSLKVEQGDRLVILGASGCGKTTLLRLIAGFIAPDSGAVFLNGKKVSENKTILLPPEKRNVGMVFQDLALWPHLTVEGNLAFGLKAQGINKTEQKLRIRRMLELVGLHGFEKRKPAELSGGQQQRVALARALILQPEVLLMDEPLSGLDYDLNVRLRSEVVHLQEKLGFTLLYVTHDREEAFSIARTVVILEHGHLKFKGDVAQAKRLLQL